MKPITTDPITPEQVKDAASLARILTRLLRDVAELTGVVGSEPPARARLHVRLADTQPRELASMSLPLGTSTLRAGVGGGGAEDEGANLRELHQSWWTGVRGVFRFDGERVEVLGDPPVNDGGDHIPVRLWLEARDGAVRVMVAGKGEPVFVRFDGLQETRAIAS